VRKKSRANGLSRRWDVAQLKSRANEMSRRWDIAQLKCRAIEMSRNWVVAQMGCRATEISRNWNVAQLKWCANKMSLKWMSRRWDGALEKSRANGISPLGTVYGSLEYLKILKPCASHVKHAPDLMLLLLRTSNVPWPSPKFPFDRVRYTWISFT